MSHHNPWVFVFGLLGNITSFVVFLAPVPTFYRIIKKKSTEGFQSVPYVVALFSAMLWMYYASVKSGEMLLITINSFGCVVETIYLAVFILYASKQARMFTLRLVLLLNFGGFCSILLLSHFLTEGSNRVKVLGWVCVAFAFSVFVAPLSIMRVVIRTKSVEFMPIHLSVFLTLSAVAWLLYGVVLKDLYVALPNILGFGFGLAQIILYFVFKNHKTVTKDQKLPENKDDLENQTIAMTTPEVPQNKADLENQTIPMTTPEVPKNKADLENQTTAMTPEVPGNKPDLENGNDNNQNVRELAEHNETRVEASLSFSLGHCYTHTPNS